MATILEHPILGRIQGKTGQGVVQYLGLKYATLKNCLAEPRLCTGTDYAQWARGGSTDATKLGPTVIHDPNACSLEQRLIQQSLPVSDLVQSDLNGLNLNITLPTGSLGLLPVFVFIHGGGFSVGSNAWPQYDLARIVQHSVSMGKPVIGVGINYRLGVSGFLTSQELRNAGYKGNNGIRDQRAAFEWIKTHIGGFHGDPDNITAVGESAGAISCTLHLQSPTPLFKRILSMSGTSLLFKPLPPPASEGSYQEYVKAFKLEDLSAEERINVLLNLPAEDLHNFTSKIPLIPVIDNDVVGPSPTYAQLMSKDESCLPGKKWTDGLMIGDCQFDASIFGIILMGRTNGICQAFRNSITNSLRNYDGAAQAILEEYHIKADSEDESTMYAILQFANDIAFAAPVTAFTRFWTPSDVYVYHFNEPNPWEGPGKGLATHILDVAFLLLNFNDHLSEPQKSTAKLFAGHFIDFVNGEAPFPACVTRTEELQIVFYMQQYPRHVTRGQLEAP
ncbi:putative carboxylesterase [Cadophora sp. DSE1049]|nr:putative carboxylesterase [Cadophora sp. DSE1049]